MCAEDRPVINKYMYWQPLRHIADLYVLFLTLQRDETSLGPRHFHHLNCEVYMTANCFECKCQTVRIHL